MTCTIGVDKDGNRFIACRRGERQPFINNEQLAIIPPSSPWQVARRVRHMKYGDGVITQRNAEAINVVFDAHADKPARTFLISYLGTCMEVLP